MSKKPDSDPVQNRIDRLDLGFEILKKHEEWVKEGFKPKTEKKEINWVCSKCGYSGNSRDIVCPECHNSYFQKDLEGEKEDPILSDLGLNPRKSHEDRDREVDSKLPEIIRKWDLIDVIEKINYIAGILNDTLKEIKNRENPIEHKTEPEKVLECHGCGTVISDGKYWCVKCLKDSENLWEKPYYELIEDLQTDLDSLSPDIPYQYEPLNKIKKKWQGMQKK